MTNRREFTAPWTIGKLLSWATGWLDERGSASPRLDVELLLAYALAAQRLDLYLNFDKPCEAGELASFKALIVRRGRGEPVAYIVGSKGFHALELQVGPGVLVPRPETEYLVDAVLQFVGESGPSGPVIDVGTGSGAIALALAHAWRARPDLAPLIALDVSEQALDYARRNAGRIGLSDRVELVRADGLAAMAHRGPFEVIVSNPPYVRSDVMARLPRDVRDHEPHLALDGGRDGLNMLRSIADAAPKCLLPGGLLAVELGSPEQGRAFVEMLTARGMRSAAYTPIGPGPTGNVTATKPARKPLTAVC